MIDASKGFRKDGPKSRLREQDIHRIVDVFTKQADVPRYARLVPLDEIAGPKNDFNLNLPRYIDSTEPEDLQDIDGHLRGDIPERDLDALGAYWKVLPSVRGVLFESAGRPGYARLKSPLVSVKPAILGHAEFAAFQQKATRGFADWRKVTTACLISFDKDGHPKALIETIAEDLLVAFRQSPLLDAYDVYQHLMDYWAETMQDDAYLISADGWVNGRAAARDRSSQEQRQEARLAGVALGKRPTATGPLDGAKRRCFSCVRHGQFSGCVRINVIFFGHLQVLSIQRRGRMSSGAVLRLSRSMRQQNPDELWLARDGGPQELTVC